MNLAEVILKLCAVEGLFLNDGANTWDADNLHSELVNNGYDADEDHYEYDIFSYGVVRYGLDGYQESGVLYAFANENGESVELDTETMTIIE